MNNDQFIIVMDNIKGIMGALRSINTKLNRIESRLHGGVVTFEDATPFPSDMEFTHIDYGGCLCPSCNPASSPEPIHTPLHTCVSDTSGHCVHCRRQMHP